MNVHEEENNPGLGTPQKKTISVQFAILLNFCAYLKIALDILNLQNTESHK
jgi:hypothetical protein